LSNSEQTIFRALTSATNRFYVLKVEEPYQKQNNELNETWIANRTLYIKTSASIKELDAKKNNRDDSMLQINLWSAALNGNYDASIVSQQIQDIREMLALKAAIEKASR
jgi:maleate cis-trans isomerase